MGILEKIEKLLSGRKTYIVAITGAILAGLQLYGIEIPEAVWTILGFLGLGALRSGVGKIKKIEPGN